MTDSVSEKQTSQAASTPEVPGATDAQALAAVPAAASSGEATEAPEAVASPAEPGARRARGGRGRRGGAGRGGERPAEAAQGQARGPGDGAREGGRGRPPRAGQAKGAGTTAAAAPKPAAAARAPRSHPVLDQLASLYPQLFGEAPLPLKRGIFQDLQDAHPGVFEREALRAALALHTRSSRYLTVVAAGQARHDLQGQVVEAMAPEHVHHALLEVFRRRQQRPGAEDLRPKLRRRIVQAFEASGLSPEAYAARVIGRDEAANQLLDEALAEAAEAAARDEARLRAFEASGQSLEAFADMYGFDPREAARTVERARRRRQLAAEVAAQAEAALTETAATEAAATEAVSADDTPAADSPAP